jgi:hypothetical protein
MAGPRRLLTLQRGLGACTIAAMLQRAKAPTLRATPWPSPDASLVAYVREDRGKIFQVYEIKPELIQEHFDTEQSVLSSGYRYRQIFEVIQNAADAILEAAEAGEDGGGRIHVRVTNSHLYVGNTGAPLSKGGIIALLGAHSSRKRKTQIGRFGLGFKSLLALGGKIDLFSRSVSIRFDPIACQKAISEELKLLSDEMAPSLRMAEVISFDGEARRDRQLVEFGSWAMTIARPALFRWPGRSGSVSSAATKWEANRGCERGGCYAASSLAAARPQSLRNCDGISAIFGG